MKSLLDGSEFDPLDGTGTTFVKARFLTASDDGNIVVFDEVGAVVLNRAKHSWVDAGYLDLPHISGDGATVVGTRRFQDGHYDVVKQSPPDGTPEAVWVETDGKAISYPRPWVEAISYTGNKVLLSAVFTGMIRDTAAKTTSRVIGGAVKESYPLALSGDGEVAAVTSVDQPGADSTWLVPTSGGPGRQLRQASGRLVSLSGANNRQQISLNHDGSEAVFTGTVNYRVSERTGDPSSPVYLHRTTAQLLGAGGVSAVIPLDYSLFGPVFSLSHIEASNDMKVILACANVPSAASTPSTPSTPTPATTGSASAPTTSTIPAVERVLAGYETLERCVVYRRG